MGREFEGSKPWLFIKEMILENFKSYGGKQHIRAFHTCFSAVVGPNESGKSNVIEAVMFVFGKRAKQLFPLPHKPNFILLSPTRSFSRFSYNVVVVMAMIFV